MNVGFIGGEREFKFVVCGSSVAVSGELFVSPAAWDLLPCALCSPRTGKSLFQKVGAQKMFQTCREHQIQSQQSVALSLSHVSRCMLLWHVCMLIVARC